MNFFRKTPAQTLPEWLAVATADLEPAAQALVRAESEALYAKALASHLANDLPETLAEALALADMGSPRAAARRFRRVYFTRAEIKRMSLPRGAAATVQCGFWLLYFNFAWNFSGGNQDRPSPLMAIIAAGLSLVNLILMIVAALLSRRKPGFDQQRQIAGIYILTSFFSGLLLLAAGLAQAKWWLAAIAGPLLFIDVGFEQLKYRQKLMRFSGREVAIPAPSIADQREQESRDCFQWLLMCMWLLPFGVMMRLDFLYVITPAFFIFVFFGVKSYRNYRKLSRLGDDGRPLPLVAPQFDPYLYRRPAETLEEWLRIAVKGLESSAQERIRDEIEAHYADAVQAYVESGRPAAEAHAVALEDLGRAQAAGRRFARQHLTTMDARRISATIKAARSLRRAVVASVLLGIMFIARILADEDSRLAFRPQAMAAFILFQFLGVVFVTLAAHTLARRKLTPEILCQLLWLEDGIHLIFSSFYVEMGEGFGWSSWHILIFVGLVFLIPGSMRSVRLRRKVRLAAEAGMAIFPSNPTAT